MAGKVEPSPDKSPSRKLTFLAQGGVWATFRPAFQAEPILRLVRTHAVGDCAHIIRLGLVGVRFFVEISRVNILDIDGNL